MKKTILVAAVVIVAAVVVIRMCSATRPPVRQEWTSMSTFAAISVPAGHAADLEGYVEQSKAEMDRLEAIFSVWKDDSEISKINAQAGQKMVPASETTRDLLNIARDYAQRTGGRFDPTMGPLLRLWGFNGATIPDIAPDDAAVSATRNYTGFARLVVTESIAYLTRPGMEIDLGGIAKGYAVDNCHDQLIAAGATDFMIDLGGNIRCVGKPSRDRAWTIGVRNPFVEGEIIGTLALGAGQATATSGNYERFVTIGTTRFAHIIDPRSGYPAEGMAGATVVCPDATQADVLSTALFVGGLKEAAILLAGMPDCEALLVPDKTPIEIWATPGMKALFSPGESYAGSIKEIRLVQQAKPVTEEPSDAP